MPEMDGFQATLELRRIEGDGRRTPVVAMTAGVLAEDRERCRAAGMDDFVAKPIDLDTLAGVLARWVGAPADPPVPSAELDAGPQVEAVDVARLTQLRGIGAADGWGILPAVIGAFLDGLPVQREAVRYAAQSGDGTALHKAAHRLRGAAANLGAIPLASVCAELETRGREGSRLDSVDDLLDQLEQELTRSSSALTQALVQPA